MFNTERSSIHTAEITDTELMANAPSIFAQQAMHGVSDRYTFLPTARIVEAMRQEGWKPIEARESRPRLEARRGYHHLVCIPVTNTSVNPARSTGPAIFVGGWALQELWMFWVAPLIGGALGGGIYSMLFGE